jgi:predicted permease
MDTVLQDIRYALRQLRARPGFAAAAILTLALGIGPTTAIFSVVNALLLRQLPVAAPERLVSIQERTEGGWFKFSHSLPEYLEYRERAADVAEIAAHHLSDIMLNTGEATSAEVALDVSGNYFEVLDIRPAVGRLFTEAEAGGPGAASVAIISYALWQNELGGDSDVVGRTIVVNSQPVTVIGVAPAGFHGTLIGARPAAWLPASLYDRLHHAGDPYRWGRMMLFQLFARLGPDVSRPQAAARLTAIARQLAQDHEYWEGAAPVGVRLREFSIVPPSMRDAIRSSVSLLLITAGFVLAIAAANVAGMLLARSVDRGREIAIRVALGARRRRVLMQLILESITLALLGGVFGLLLAAWLTDLLATLRPPRAEGFQLDLGLDTRVLAFAMAVTVATGLAFGIAPAAYAVRRNVNETLKEATDPRRMRLRGAMVVGQLAVSLVLLVTAGLFVRTLQSALSTRHEFDPENVLAVELDLRLNDYDEPRGRAFYARLLERVRALPGAESAALAEVVPLGFMWQERAVSIPGFDPPPDQPGFAVGYNVVSPEYFQTLRMPLTEGRAFDQSDRRGRSRVVIINETFARRFWPNESPVGRWIEFARRPAEIVGVVPAGRYRAFDEEPTPYAYVPFGQEYHERMWLHVRGRRDLPKLMAAIRQEIRTLDPNVAPVSGMTVEDILGSSLFPQRLAAGLVGGFGMISLILTAVGVFGLLSFTVVQRTREIGLRMALGAKQGDVVRLVLRRGFALVAIGAAAGLVVALLATRLVRGLLVNVSPADPVTLIAVVGLLAMVALVAAWVPARRAARVDPMVALRAE